MTYEYKYINNKKLVTLYNVNHNHNHTNKVNKLKFIIVFIYGLS